MNSSGDVTIEASTALNSETFNGEDDEEDIGNVILRCWECNINFTSKLFLYKHLFHHIKQPQVSLKRLQLPPLKLTLKSTTPNSFEVINSVSSEELELLTFNLAELEDLGLFDGQEQGVNDDDDEEEDDTMIDHYQEQHDNDLNVNFSPSFATVDVPEPSPANSDGSIGGTKTTGDDVVGEGSECGSIPGAEPTPPPEPSPDYPKIRIKTTGLLKEPLTITEITDDNPEGDPSRAHKKNFWENSLEDPLKLTGPDDILSIFNNNERAKDFGFTTSDTEFMPLDRLDPDRNRNALRLYNQPPVSQSSLANSLAGLPMEALAQQVSRLQPSNNGMHQQNVLINIQQFPQAPHPPPPYQPPHMYHHPPQPMYHQPYPSYPPPVPPTSMYYPPGGGYPQHMPPPPPQPQIPLGPSPMSQPSMGQPPVSQPQPMQQQQQQQHQQQQQLQQQQLQQQQQSYRQVGPRQPQPPRPMQPQQRIPLGGASLRQPMPNQRQPLPRQRPPMIRARGGGVMSPMRGVRPRMPMPQNGQIRSQGAVKRSPQEIQAQQAKKKRFDVLTPDKDDDDCQVICMQPKNTDGGLPQISSVQGGTPEPAESSVMHLSDSITLSVRNPQPRPQSPKKSDAKAVANILATRGITVTATPKAKEKIESAKNSPSSPQPHTLNAAVSIIPSAKNNVKQNSSSQESQLPTVDLTDDSSPASSQTPTKSSSANMAQKPNQRQQGLPFRCDLCPAQYPNAAGLSKHRQNYHKTNSGMCELGVPLVNLKQQGIFQKLSSLGIYNYIPLPSSGPDGMFALPVINGRNPGNVAALGATQMLTLGPVRSIPRPSNTVNGAQLNKIPSNHHNSNITVNSGNSPQK